MLACVPPPGDLSHRLPSPSQMNTGLQKWDITQKMRSAQYPTPAELDAYAKKVANSPLTIKIFPNSVKVPQRKHVRRTVNGLDTAGNRYSPYPPQASAKAGLLAVVRVPFKGVLRDLGGSRARQPNPLTGHYAAQGTLTLPQVALPHPPQGPPRAPALAQPAVSCLQTIPQTVGHLPSSSQLPQALCPAQPLPHPSILLHPPVLQGRRKVPAGQVPPNVTVSTSTIPLSMAAGLRQSRPADLSGIVHRIGQFCQARAGVGGTSMCEGRIANPSPLGCSLLVCASSRGCPTHYPAQGPLLSCTLTGTAASADEPAARGPSGVAGISQMPVYRDRSKPPCSWNQHHLPRLQPISEERSREHPGGSGFLARTAGYAPLLCTNQAFSLKPPLDKATPSPPGGVAYANGHYFQPLWNGVLPAARSQSSAPPDLALPFQVGVPVDCTLGTHYRTGAGSSSQTNAMQAVDYVIRDFQVPCFRDQSLSMMGKVPQLGGALEQADSRHPHIPGYR